MSLVTFNVSNFRNIEALSFEPSPEVNVIIGENGSGKSSLLEAIYFLSHGKSFRTSKFKAVIQHQKNAMVLHGKKQFNSLQIPVGLQKERSGDTLAKVHGKRCDRMAQLAEVLPVQVITPESFELFFGGPKERRRFLDLGLFHVEQEFYYHWYRFNKLLKHRNALLKQKPHGFEQQIQFWDKEFVTIATKINTLRTTYITRLSNLFFDKIASQIELFKSLTFDFSPGWKAEDDLAEQLSKNFERDAKLGYTSKGPHKADINFLIDGIAVDNFLSRGQLKLLMYALKICQNSLIESETDKQSLFLIDDLPSELSSETKQAVSELLAHSNSQLFISAIDYDSISAVVEPLNKNMKVFHVKHGKLITS